METSVTSQRASALAAHGHDVLIAGGVANEKLSGRRCLADAAPVDIAVALALGVTAVEDVRDHGLTPFPTLPLALLEAAKRRWRRERSFL